MRKHISESLRKLVAERAEFRCEYCLAFAKHSFFAFHIDHIISLKHRGNSDLHNLAYACPICNINKGSDIATFVAGVSQPVRFYNPRKDVWLDHFELELNGSISAKTSIGEATLTIFEMNHPDSIIERIEMMQRGLF